MIKKHKKASLLILLCWLVYTCSYIGKLGYNANITQIEAFYGVSHAQTGMATTFFFFAYGLGQIINGAFCKKYNIRFVVFGSLLISGLMNLFIAFVDTFETLKYLWMINGAALSILWTSLIRLLSENLDEKYMARAVVIMGTTVASGTFLVYGFSA
jgi:OPA family glycerol-3-phosphate transporter-like MFS transporter